MRCLCFLSAPRYKESEVHCAMGVLGALMRLTITGIYLILGGFGCLIFCMLFLPLGIVLIFFWLAQTLALLARSFGADFSGVKR